MRHRIKTTIFTSGIELHTHQYRLMGFLWWVSVGSYATNWKDKPYGDMSKIDNVRFNYE